MRQIWIAKKGGYDALDVREAPDPTPGPDEVVIDVRASGVNFADVLARMGMYPDAPPIPCVVGYEVAGVVETVGPVPPAAGGGGTVGQGGKAGTGAPTARADTTGAAEPLEVGDRVMALTRFGGYATKVSVPRNQVFRMPSEMDFATAAAIPVNYFTAYLAVARFGNLQADERILVHNAGGGVGIAAIQLGRAAGARVYGTASSWKHERLRELGADELIDYRAVDWETEITKATSGGGVHVIIDPIGGKNLARDLRVLAPLGRLVAFGFSEPVRNGTRSFLRTLRSFLSMPRPHFLSLLNNNHAVAGLNLGHLWSEIDRLRDVGTTILDAWRAGTVAPVIAAEVPFEEPADAHRLLEERMNLGKVVLVT
ncbi:MAG: synaptic vesicle VAT-1 family membrane protein [Spirochaetota bacterium]